MSARTSEDLRKFQVRGSIANRPVFVLRLQPLPEVDTIKALRALLKRALRSYGLRCVGLREEPSDSC